MESEAVPFESATRPRSTPVLASKKSTVPEGMADPGQFPVTVAITVNVRPSAPVTREVVAVVCVASGMTV